MFFCTALFEEAVLIFTNMAKKVRFIATETVTKPVKVKFKTKSGQTVTFKQKKVVSFRTKKK